MEYAPKEVMVKKIPVSDLIYQCNKSNLLCRSNNYYSSSTDQGNGMSESDCSVEFKYAEVASENEDNDEADFNENSMLKLHRYGQESVSTITTESSVMESVAYFNSLKRIPEDTSNCTITQNTAQHRTISSNLVKEIESQYNYQLQQYISESGNTALYKYIEPNTHSALSMFTLPEYVPPESLESNIRIDASLSQLAISPVFHKYQLLGDSQLLRFSEAILGLRRWRLKGNRSRIGYCVSGQNVAELGARIRATECRLHSRVIVLIGTNDMRKNTDVLPILGAYSDLVTQLEGLCDKIVLLTVPPLPFVHDRDPKLHINRLKIINEFIKDLGNENNIFVLDLCSLFISFDNTVSKDYFEKFLGVDKVDMIHLNKCGFKILRTLLDIQYFEKYKF